MALSVEVLHISIGLFWPVFVQFLTLAGCDYTWVSLETVAV